MAWLHALQQFHCSSVLQYCFDAIWLSVRRVRRLAEETALSHTQYPCHSNLQWCNRVRLLSLSISFSFINCRCSHSLPRSLSLSLPLCACALHCHYGYLCSPPQRSQSTWRWISHLFAEVYFSSLLGHKMMLLLRTSWLIRPIQFAMLFYCIPAYTTVKVCVFACGLVLCIHMIYCVDSH